MGQLTLLHAIHNHQPDGNFGHVFEQAYADCYGPLIDAIGEFPSVKMTLHHTGPLLEWIERERPAYFDKLRALVGRGQVELLGGGFYEPMLAVLPERDARGQIHMMSEYLEAHFGVRPEGMWLAERVWEPALAKLIADAGMKFTLVDDGHFRAAGLEGTLRGYYVTEKAGTPLALFPIDKKLREAIPFLKAWESIDVIERLRQETEGDAAVTYGDDGEKFGVWPHTKEWVWDQGWLRDFLRILVERQQQGTFKTEHFGEYLRTHRPTGRVYLPTASYEEMGEWTLPADAQQHYNEVRQSLRDRGELDRARAFFRGGIWQNFLAKYPEANYLHKKMVWVSDKLARAEEKLGASATSTAGGGHPLDHARRELYRAQCNCGYWHGLFGGLYLNYLRDAVYRHLIEAEAHAERVLGTGDKPLVVEADIDADLQREVILQNAEAAAYVKPDLGGGVFELDYRPKRFNLLNVLGRRAEGYHGRLLEAARKQSQGGGGGPVSIHDLNAVKSAGLEELLAYDRHPRLGFVDHFLAPGTTLEALHGNRYGEDGDFAGTLYDVIDQSASSAAARVHLRRRGRVAGRAVTVDKTITLEGARLTAAYRISAEGSAAPLTFASESSLTLLAGDAPDRYYRVAGRELSKDERKLASAGELPAGTTLELVDEWDKFFVRVSATPGALLWRHPLETASQSEGGFERTYQASVIVPVWRDVSVGDGVPFECKVTIEMIAI
ncbi:MAG TPA: alpha-amylase/4-alpha-glucanotransferase domain-containing protein [Polyangia bacterium]|nr:alpha-amylase/4-alpha-glucanotransferase domain-containing protein [Polyangia bacterium]